MTMLLKTTTSYASLDFVEDVANQNYKRFLISGAVMGLLAKFAFQDDTNTSVQKALHMGASTLLSDLILAVGVKMGYLDNNFSGNYQLMVGQVALETMLYFPLASGGQIFIPNFSGNAFRQALISSGSSQVAQMFLTVPKSTN